MGIFPNKTYSIKDNSNLILKPYKGIQVFKDDYSRVGETRYMISTSNLSRHISLKTSYDKDKNELIINELPLNMTHGKNDNQKINIFVDGIPVWVERDTTNSDDKVWKGAITNTVMTKPES